MLIYDRLANSRLYTQSKMESEYKLIWYESINIYID